MRRKLDDLGIAPLLQQSFSYNKNHQTIERDNMSLSTSAHILFLSLSWTNDQDISYSYFCLPAFLKNIQNIATYYQWWRMNRGHWGAASPISHKEEVDRNP